MSGTLFDKYGGFATLSKLVEIFYQKVMDSDNLAPYFHGVGMTALMDHQTNFIAKALGGPDRYEGRDLAEVHKPFNISAEDFNEVAELLEEALEEMEVGPDDIKGIMALIAGLKDQITSA